MKESNRYRQTIGRLNVVVSAANMCGALLTIFYFSGLPGQVTAGLMSNIAVTGLLLAGLLVLGNLLPQRYTAPLRTWYAQATRSDRLAPAPPEVQRLALEMPLVSALSSFAMWVVAGLVFGVAAALDMAPGRFDWGVMLQTLIGSALVSGPVTAVLIYFSAERIWRSELPLFFPVGGLVETPAFRLTIRKRLLLLFAMSAMPLLLLAALSYGQAVAIAAAEQPASLLPQLLQLELILVAGGLLAAVGLARTMGASLVESLETLGRQLSAVQQGRLDVRMAVQSNDEIGLVSTHFNSMAEALERRTLELETVYQMSQDMTASLELEQTLGTMLERVRQMIPYDEASVYLYDTPGGVLRRRAGARADGVQVEDGQQVCRLGDEGAGRVGQEQRSLLAPTASGETFLGVPLLIGQKLVGVVELRAQRATAFDEHDRQLLETIAPQAAIAVENAQQVAERERLLREQIARLRIEIDETKKARQVAEITETDYFRELQDRARGMREERKEQGAAE